MKAASICHCVRHVAFTLVVMTVLESAKMESIQTGPVVSSTPGTLFGKPPFLQIQVPRG